MTEEAITTNHASRQQRPTSFRPGTMERKLSSKRGSSPRQRSGGSSSNHQESNTSCGSSNRNSPQSPNSSNKNNNTNTNNNNSSSRNSQPRNSSSSSSSRNHNNHVKKTYSQRKQEHFQHRHSLQEQQQQQQQQQQGRHHPQRNLSASWHSSNRSGNYDNETKLGPSIHTKGSLPQEQRRRQQRQQQRRRQQEPSIGGGSMHSAYGGNTLGVTAHDFPGNSLSSWRRNKSQFDIDAPRIQASKHALRLSARRGSLDSSALSPPQPPQPPQPTPPRGSHARNSTTATTASNDNSSSIHDSFPGGSLLSSSWRNRQSHFDIDAPPRLNIAPSQGLLRSSARRGSLDSALLLSNLQTAAGLTEEQKAWAGIEGLLCGDDANGCESIATRDVLPDIVARGLGRKAPPMTSAALLAVQQRRGHDNGGHGNDNGNNYEEGGGEESDSASDDSHDRALRQMCGYRGNGAGMPDLMDSSFSSLQSEGTYKSVLTYLSAQNKNVVVSSGGGNGNNGDGTAGEGNTAPQSQEEEAALRHFLGGITHALQRKQETGPLPAGAAAGETNIFDLFRWSTKDNVDAATERADHKLNRNSLRSSSSSARQRVAFAEVTSDDDNEEEDEAAPTRHHARPLRQTTGIQGAQHAFGYQQQHQHQHQQTTGSSAVSLSEDTTLLNSMHSSYSLSQTTQQFALSQQQPNNNHTQTSLKDHGEGYYEKDHNERDSDHDNPEGEYEQEGDCNDCDDEHGEDYTHSFHDDDEEEDYEPDDNDDQVHEEQQVHEEDDRDYDSQDDDEQDEDEREHREGGPPLHIGGDEGEYEDYDDNENHNRHHHGGTPTRVSGVEDDNAYQNEGHNDRQRQEGPPRHIGGAEVYKDNDDQDHHQHHRGPPRNIGGDGQHGRNGPAEAPPKKKVLKKKLVRKVRKRKVLKKVVKKKPEPPAAAANDATDPEGFVDFFPAMSSPVQETATPSPQKESSTHSRSIDFNKKEKNGRYKIATPTKLASSLRSKLPKFFKNRRGSPASVLDTGRREAQFYPDQDDSEVAWGGLLSG